MAVASPSPLDLIRRALPDLPPRLREAAHFLTDHVLQASTQPLRALAAAADVNPDRFIRLAQALGYASWDALQDALVETCRPEVASTAVPTAVPAPALATPAADVPRAPPSRVVLAPVHIADPAPDPAWIAHAMIEADLEGLDRVAEQPIVAAAVALHGAPHVWVAGFRSCLTVAELLAYQLRLFRPGEVSLVGIPGPEDLDFSAFRPGHAVVVAGMSPYLQISVETARAARAAGCTLIVLADAATAPLAEAADHLLLFEAAAGPGFCPSLTGAVTQAQALTAAAFVLGGQAAQLRLQGTEARLAAYLHDLSEPPSKPSNMADGRHPAWDRRNTGP